MREHVILWVVVEWLKLRVPREIQPRFLEADARIWTPLLASYPGFVGKHTWSDVDDPDALILVIHWQTLAQWKAIPSDMLVQTEQRFITEMGQGFAFLETKTFGVLGE